MNGISEEEAVQLFEGIRKNSQSDGIAPYADLVDHYQVVSKTFTYSKNSTYSATSEATLWLRGKGSYTIILLMTFMRCILASSMPAAIMTSMYCLKFFQLTAAPLLWARLQWETGRRQSGRCMLRM